MAIRTRNEIQIFNHLSIYLATKWKKIISIWIWWFIYLFIFPTPPPHFWGLKAFKNHFFLKIFILNFFFWWKVLGKKSIGAMQWARHGYLHFCMLWEPPQFGFGVVGALVTSLLRQLEDVGRGSKHMLGRHYPMEASLVESIWKGLGFLPSSGFLKKKLGEFSQFVKNVLEKESPKFIYFLHHQKLQQFCR